jgi:hypothetical protein
MAAAACLLAAAVAGLAAVLATWLAALIVGGALLICTGIVAMAGKRQISRGTSLIPQQTAGSVKLDAQKICERARQFGRTRAEFSETVEQLAAKVHLGARARHAAGDTQARAIPGAARRYWTRLAGAALALALAVAAARKLRR